MKYKIGYTSGVFDLFHIGHLRVLEKAKEQCEMLIVGVSTDELTYSYKHKYPNYPYEERAEIIKALRCVDKVIPQTSMDKMMVWEKLRFNVLFHGSDWAGTDMYNKIVYDFNKLNVDVVFFPHTEGISSTMLTEKLEKRVVEFE